jgi:hypothetical protein
MPTKKYKDKENLISQTRIWWKGKFYFDVYLWKDLDNLLKNIIKDKVDGDWNKTRACCVFNPTYLVNGKEKILPKLGEIHFLKTKWEQVDVAHELSHAFMVIIDLWPLKKEKRSGCISKCLTSNEDKAYAFGRWFDKIYRWLWEIDPYNKKWKRIKE